MAKPSSTNSASPTPFSDGKTRSASIMHSQGIQRKRTAPTQTSLRRTRVSRRESSADNAARNDDDSSSCDNKRRYRNENRTKDLHPQNFPPLNVSVQVTERRPYRHESFPEKLHRMLNEVESSGKNHTVSWTPCGKAFEIHDQDAFQQGIIPQYFRHNRIASFRRQLSMYGFRRASVDQGLGGFAHEQFHRDHPEACTSIKRTSEIQMKILPPSILSEDSI